MYFDKFENRREAGQKLARKLLAFTNSPDTIVLALPRGGVPVAYEVATTLEVPLDVFIVRKIGVPGHPELAMGAIASGGCYHLNMDVIRELYIPEVVIQSVIKQEKLELKRREEVYRQERGPLDLKGKQVILVDDGLATGASMRAAIQAVKTLKPKKLVAAVPVIAASSVPEIASEVDELTYVLAPDEFYSVGQWYEEFSQTTDEEVNELLSETNRYTKVRSTHLKDFMSPGSKQFSKKQPQIPGTLIASPDCQIDFLKRRKIK